MKEIKGKWRFVKVKITIKNYSDRPKVVITVRAMFIHGIGRLKLWQEVFNIHNEPKYLSMCTFGKLSSHINVRRDI